MEQVKDVADCLRINASTMQSAFTGEHRMRMQSLAGAPFGKYAGCQTRIRGKFQKRI